MRKHGTKGVTLVELVVVMAVSLIAIGMILSMTAAISTQLVQSRQSEAVTAELTRLSRFLEREKDEIVDGKTTLNYDGATKVLTIATIGKPDRTLRLEYLSALSSEIKPNTAVKINFTFKTKKDSMVFSVLFGIYV